MSLDNIEYLNFDRSKCFNLYAYCNNNPIIYSDPEGEFGILAGLLIGAAVGAAIGGGVAVGKEIINNGWNPADWNWRNIGAGALIGAANGLSLSAGGLVAGGVISGFAASVGTFVGTTALSYGAGIGSYAIKNGEKSSFSIEDMFACGLKTAINSMFNFFAGYLFTKAGFWDNIYDKSFTKIRNDIIESIGKKRSLIKAIIVYSKEFGSQTLERSLVRNGIWWLLNEL